MGFKPMDALHIACAEESKVDVLLTTDDRLVNMAQKFRRLLHIDVMNPLQWIEKVVES